MDRAEILTQVQDVVREVLDDDDIILHDTTTADAVPGWDSLAHVRIMVAIEKNFRVRFDVDELGEMSDVGVMLDMIRSKL